MKVGRKEGSEGKKVVKEQRTKVKKRKKGKK
jgi:hypothetical protein